MGDIIGRDDEYLGPFGLPTGIRWGFPARPLLVGYVWESVVPNHAPALENQMEVVQGCDKIYHDKIVVKSGEMSPRTQLKEMLNFLHGDDTVVVYNLGCLGTSAMEVIGCVTSLLTAFNCHLHIPENIDTTDPGTFATVLGMCQGLLWAETDNFSGAKRWIGLQRGGTQLQNP